MGNVCLPGNVPSIHDSGPAGCCCCEAAVLQRCNLPCLPVASVASCRSHPLLECPSPSHLQSTSVHCDCSAALPVPTTVEVQERVSGHCTVTGTVPTCLAPHTSNERPVLGASAKGDARNGLNVQQPLHCPTRLKMCFTTDSHSRSKREAIYTCRTKHIFS